MGNKSRSTQKKKHIKKQVNKTSGTEETPDLSVPRDNMITDNGDNNEPNMSDILSHNESTAERGTIKVNEWKRVSHKNVKTKIKNDYINDENQFLSQTNCILNDSPPQKDKFNEKIFKKNARWNITGANKENPIKAVGKKIAFFISRIAPNTELNQFQTMVKQKFPEADCHELKSKHPDKYSSFKVIIDAFNRETATNGDHWPDGAVVLSFL